MLIKVEVLEAVGLLDEDYFFSFEDLAYCLRARRAGFSTVLVEDALVYHLGSRSIGQSSPSRLYFAARNHFLLAARCAPTGTVHGALRSGAILALNLAHALRTSDVPLAAAWSTVARGTLDYHRGRLGRENSATTKTSPGK
jgi:GT2 family glycosyltransferase